VIRDIGALWQPLRLDRDVIFAGRDSYRCDGWLELFHKYCGPLGGGRSLTVAVPFEGCTICENAIVGIATVP